MDELKKLFSYLPNAEAVFITMDENIRYFTKAHLSDSFLLAFPNGDNYILTDSRYTEAATAEAKDCQVIEYGRFYHDIYELLKKHSATNCYLESKVMTLEDFNLMRGAIRNIKFETSTKLSNAIYKCRTVKTQDEIDKMIKAQRIAEKALEETKNFIKVGVTEKEIALCLDYNMRKLGAEDLSFTTIALSGANSSMPHGIPSDRKVCEHEFVLMDFGAIYEGYHSDMTRMVSVGEPTNRMREIYDIVLHAQTAALASAKAGMTGFELDKIARDIITEAGYGEKFGHSTGHGVGLEIHEFPLASPRSTDTVYEENNIVTVEPGIYLPGEFGIRIEDFIVIKKDGCLNMTEAPKNLVVL